MKKLLLLFVLLSISFCKAQSWQWGKAESAQGEGYGVCNDAAGNAYLTGAVYGTAAVGPYTITGNSIVLLKYDPNGNLLWLRNFVCSSGYGNSVCCDKNGNVFLTGTYNTSITIGTSTYTNSGGAGVVIIKFNSSGNILWSNIYNGSPGASGGAVCVDPSGNAVITGNFTGPAVTIGSFTINHSANTPTGSISCYIAKFDPNGTPLWALGNATGFVGAAGVGTDMSGNIYMCSQASGTFGMSTNTFVSAGVSDIYLVKYSPLGSLLWEKTYGGTNNDQPYDISVDSCSNVFVAGSFYSPSLTVGSSTLINHTSTYTFNTADAFLLRLDAAGNEIWTRNAGSSANEFGFSVASDGRNVFLAGGQYSLNIIAGNFTLVPQYTIDCSYVVQYDYSGNVVYATNLGGGGDDYFSISLDHSSNLYLGSDLIHTITINSQTVAPTYTESLFIAKLNYLSQPTPTVSISGNTALCLGQSSTLSVSGAQSYTWINGPVNTNYTVSPAGTTQYSLLANTTAGCLNTSATVTVNPLPSLTLTASKNPICKGNSVVLSCFGAGTGTWSPGAATGNSVTMQPTVTTVYTCIATDNNNCSNSKTISVVVSSCTALPEIAGEEIKIYPNPSNGFINFETGNNTIDQLVITNAMGAIVIEKKNISLSQQFDMSTFHKGIYFFTLSDQSKTTTLEVIRN